VAAPVYRAFHFVHPDFALSGEVPGLRFTPAGGIEMVEREASVRQAIFLLLTTRPGERVMRPDYGCEIHLLIFSPNDDTTAGLAIYYVRRANDRWEPRIEITHLDAQRDPDDASRLNVILEYRVRATQQLQAMTLPINLLGEVA